jgi:uncharacterized protein YhdP
MDEVNYGNWSLLLRPTSHGAVFEKIQGVVKGITISGADDPASGARIEWNISNTGGATTHFVGALSAANISDVLLQWGKPDSIDSTSAHARVDALWAGDPQDFSLAKINGTMDVALEHGRFKRSPSVGSDGFLRLMGVLNFDSLARRLRLDFSDLYSSGLAYDQIDGKVRFDQGTMIFTEPLLVQTPSSRLQMAGSLDVAHETLNTHLVATVPVVRTYALYTALLAGWPVAVVTYAFTKLFKKQVDRATSISYRIVGDWSDPKMTFDRLFESEDDLRKPAK